MSILKLTCGNGDCKEEFEVDESNFVDEDSISIFCPKCGLPVKKIERKVDRPVEGKRDSGPEMGAGGKAAVVETSRRKFTIEEAEKIKVLGWLVKITGRTGVYELKYGKQTVGRANSTKTSDIPIVTSDNTTSGAHCMIEINVMNEGFLEYLISDHTSLNGVYVGSSAKLKPGEKVRLLNGIRIFLGGNQLVFLSIEKVSSKEEALDWVKRNVK